MERTMERSSHSKKDPVFHCYMRTRGYCPVNGMVRYGGYTMEQWYTGCVSRKPRRTGLVRQ